MSKTKEFLEMVYCVYESPVLGDENRECVIVSFPEGPDQLVRVFNIDSCTWYDLALEDVVQIPLREANPSDFQDAKYQMSDEFYLWLYGSLLEDDYE
jgi:hypothetical protein